MPVRTHPSHACPQTNPTPASTTAAPVAVLALMKQSEVAKQLGIAQPNVSALLNYRLDNFSSEKLPEFFNALGYDVDFLIRPTARAQRGTTQVKLKTYGSHDAISK